MGKSNQRIASAIALAVIEMILGVGAAITCINEVFVQPDFWETERVSFVCVSAWTVVAFVFAILLICIGKRHRQKSNDRAFYVLQSPLLIVLADILSFIALFFTILMIVVWNRTDHRDYWSGKHIFLHDYCF